VGILVITTIIGGKLAGKQENIRDFFLGGKRLPWYAVSASIIATEISTVTYISLPFVVFKPGGNLTYLQLGLIGSFIARCIVGYVLVPAYYRKEIYSPYDFMGDRLGETMRRATTILFSCGGILAQASRVYLTAVVLEVILHPELQALALATGISPLVACVFIISLVAIGWTLMGGIATVVFTDAILFLLFIVGIVVSLIVLGDVTDGGLSQAFEQGWDAGKFQFFDFDAHPTKAYTFWVALFAASWGGIGAYGTDQMMAQRLLCCGNARMARRAIISSIAGMGITFAVALIGIGLWAYYQEQPLSGEALALVNAKGDRIFPIFIATVIPEGLKGLVLAGALAAAISSLDSILAALSQTTLSAFYIPGRKKRLAAMDSSPNEETEARHRLKVSRVLVVIWGVVLGVVSVSMEWAATHYQSILDLALAMASFVGGTLLAGFALAMTPRVRDASGFVWSAPLAILTVVAVAWQNDNTAYICTITTILVAAGWLFVRLINSDRNEKTMLWRPHISFLCTSVIIPVIAFLPRYFDPELKLLVAWPWYVPIGSSITYFGAILLARTQPFDSHPEQGLS
jgi:SSS family solute:Na+ symporter